MTLCDFSDLPTDSCAHCNGIEDFTIAATYYRAGAPDLKARCAGVCGHCEQRFHEGEVITLAKPDDGSEAVWCLSGHVRKD